MSKIKIRIEWQKIVADVAPSRLVWCFAREGTLVVRKSVGAVLVVWDITLGFGGSSFLSGAAQGGKELCGLFGGTGSS